MTEVKSRDEIAKLAKSLYERGLTFGSSGNMSVRLDDGWLMTPTGVSMAEIDPGRISKLDVNGSIFLATSRPKRPSCILQCMNSGPQQERLCIYIQRILLL